MGICTSAAAAGGETRRGTAAGAPEVVLDTGKYGIEQLTAGNDQDVHGAAGPGWMLTEHFSNQTFSPISSDRGAELFRSHDSEPSARPRRGSHQKRQIATVHPHALIEDLLKLSAAADPLRLRKTAGRHCKRVDRRPTGSSRQPRRAGPGPEAYDETVRRLRPLARRRLRTSRPFFVLMRTRNPCVRLRRRRFGWNVRFMMSDSCGLQIRAEKPSY